MKDYAAFQGNYEIRGSRDAIRYALKENLITDEKWMSTINARNLTSHDYNEDTATQIAKDIRNVYFKLFCDFADKMESSPTPTSPTISTGEESYYGRGRNNIVTLNKQPT
jgi:hypothetical protein